MITLPNLKIKIARNLQRPASDFVLDGFDMLLDAINQSYQKAQRDYDFELMKGVVDTTASIAAGGVVTPSLLHGTNTVVGVKKVLSVSMVDPSGTNAIRPINFANKDSQIEDLRQRWRELNWASDIRYPAYPIPMQGSYPPWLIQQGNNLSLYPADQSIWGLADTTTLLSLYLDAIITSPNLHNQLSSTCTSTTTGSLVDSASNFITLGINVGDVVYNAATGLSSTVTVVAIHTLTLSSALVMTSGNAHTVSSPTNFLFEHGDEWLFWNSVCILNTLVKEFVPREQGNIVNPEKERDKAWADLLQWDAHLTATAATSYNLD